MREGEGGEWTTVSLSAASYTCACSAQPSNHIPRTTLTCTVYPRACVSTKGTRRRATLSQAAVYTQLKEHCPLFSIPPSRPFHPPPPSIHRHTTLQSRDPKPLKLSSSPSTSWLGPSPLLAPLSAVACLSWSHQVPSWVFRSSPCCLTLLVVAFPAAVLAVLPGECECVCFCGRTLVFALPPDFGLWVLAPSCEWKNRRAESGRREKEGERKEKKIYKKEKKKKKNQKKKKRKTIPRKQWKSGRRKRKEKKNFMRRAVSVGWW